MDLLKILVTLSVLLALYIIYAWWARSGGLGKFENQYHVLGCYASDTIVDYPTQIRSQLEKLNNIEAQLEQADLKDLQWLDELLPELSNKLEVFEKSYYQSKADNVKSILVEKKLQDAINQHEQCLARVSYHDPQDCESIRQSEREIKLQIDRNFGDINRLNAKKKQLQEDFEREKQRKHSPQPRTPSIAPKDNEIARIRTILLNTKDKIRDNQKQKRIVLERIETNKNNLDKCAASRQLAKICQNITATLSQFVDQQYHLVSIQQRIDIKTKQFNILKDAIQSCTGNCDDANSEADKCRAELMKLIKIQAELREQQAKCKELCTSDQIAAFELERNQLQYDRQRNAKSLNDLQNQADELQKQIKQLQRQMVVVPPVADTSIQPNMKLKQISDDITQVYKNIKDKHGNIQYLVDSMHNKDNIFSEHARNIQILNSCAVLREVAEKLTKQVYDQSQIPGLSNRITLSKSELIKILNRIKKL